MMLRILICFFFAITILSCTKQSEEDTPITTDNVNEENVPEVDSKDFSIKNNPIELEDATSLVVLDDKNTSSTSGKAENLFLQSNLFKVSSSGQTENLSLFSSDIDNQDYSENILVEKIHILNDEYIVLEGTFSISIENEVVIEYNKILVRKNDGALFSFEMFPNNAKKGPNGENPFQSDTEGNIYYLNGNMVYKMDTSDPEKITIEEYLSAGQSASYFSVDSMGNCIYSDDILNIKIRKKNGSILLLESLTDKTVHNYWKGRDGNIHLLTNHGGATNIDSTTGISSIMTNNDELEIVLLWEGNTAETVAIELNMGTYQYILDQDENGIYFFGYGNESWRFNELSKTVDIIEVPDNSSPILSSFNQYSVKSYSTKYMYLAKGTDLYEIDLADLSYSTLLDNGYEMYNILLLENGHIQISALRYNDGIKILVELDLNGNLKILNENENKEAIVLIKLN